MRAKLSTLAVLLCLLAGCATPYHQSTVYKADLYHERTRYNDHDYNTRSTGISAGVEIHFGRGE